jgi:hypothetical protein
VQTKAEAVARMKRRNSRLLSKAEAEAGDLGGEDR